MTAGRHPEPLLVLTGPTGVGKTTVAVEVARRLGAEIVCADAMQIYRRMEAGTAKPSAEERAAVPHHLFDFVDPATDFSVADYRAVALSLLQQLLDEGRLPLLVGGSRGYIKALTAPFVSGPPPDTALRARLANEPSGALHARLAEVDPVTAARLAPRDRKRITRALEVYAQTGTTIATLQAESQAEAPPFEAVLIALMRDREELYARVNQRVERMIASGLIEEVQGFLDEGLGPERIAMQAHGYKEVMGTLLGRYDRAEAIRQLKRNTRRYVKYQLIWLRGEPEAHWVRADRPMAEVVEECVQIAAVL